MARSKKDYFKNRPKRPKKIEGPENAFGLARKFTLAPIADGDLAALETLMHRYADRPMDFADATLVHVAEREGLNTILTIDHNDFEAYRIGRKAKFRILPIR